MKKEEFVEKMGPVAWNDYVVPAINGPLRNIFSVEEVADIVYHDIILSALRSAGLLCTASQLEKILSHENMTSGTRQKLLAILERKASEVVMYYNNRG